ncbi:response regulator [uncultured Desulfobacter sp.]|uniref:response regulator n=1 Tax=uncultured Desulfobacter sp. TaxID=240139 RepID=UPI0029F51B27|nr:response regulator [uncultured Desulfobacter sp.]
MNPNNYPERPILLVEDNPMDIDLTLRAFKKEGLSNPIELARDGEEALDFISRWEQGAPLPLIILMDLKLPKVGGLEVTRRIDETASKISISAFAYKPVVTVDLSKTVRKVLDEAKKKFD